MLFNYGKSKCLHSGHGNEDAHYTMGDTALNTTVKEKDLGITISAYMKVSKQCRIAAAKVNQIVFKILNGYENIDRNIFVRLRKREGLGDIELH